MNEERRAAPENRPALHWQLAGTAARMLALARQGKWGALPVLDQRFRALVDRLPPGGGVDLLAPAEREQAATLLAQTRAAQQELEGLLWQHLQELARSLEDLSRRKNLAAVYRPEP